ncbi:MAG: response regulator [Planctomycetales bacterium]|nr:response regulator [Planctomycetales bacterium]
MTGASPTLLISDDDRDLRETLGELFFRRGMEVVLAEDGEQAIDLVSRVPVHVALLDLHMPKRTGLEVLEYLHDRQRDPGQPRLACILMSAQLDELVVERAREVEVFRVQSKPFSIREIQSLVATALHDVHGWAENEN